VHPHPVAAPFWRGDRVFPGFVNPATGWPVSCGGAPHPPGGTPRSTGGCFFIGYAGLMRQVLRRMNIWTWRCSAL